MTIKGVVVNAADGEGNYSYLLKVVVVVVVGGGSDCGNDY